MKKIIIVFFLSILFIPIEFTAAEEKFLSLKKIKFMLDMVQVLTLQLSIFIKK